MDTWDNSKKVLRIQHVRDRELLWNAAHQLYSKKDHKEKGWSDIGTVMKSSKHEVKAQWRSLRVNYMAERRKKKGKYGAGTDDVISKWTFFKEMDFLNTTLKKSVSYSNFVEEDDNEIPEESQFGLNDENSIVDINTEDPGFALIDNEVQPEVVHIVNPSPDPLTSNPSEHNRQTKTQRQKRKREDEEAKGNIELMSAVAESLRNKPLNDSDDHFLLVMKDYFKRIPESHEKDKFKLSILSQVIEFSNSN